MEMKLADSGRGRPWLVYLLLFLFVAAAAVFLNWSAADDSSVRQAAAANPTAASDSIAAISAVNEFATFTTQRRAVRDAQKDHAYTAEGLRLLSAALYAITNRDSVEPSRYAGVAAHMLESAYAIELDSSATTHADLVRSAFRSASAALTNIQKERYPDLHSAVIALREAADAMKVDRPLLSQVESIQLFFDRASDTLRAMAEVGL